MIQCRRDKKIGSAYLCEKLAGIVELLWFEMRDYLGYLGCYDLGDILCTWPGVNFLWCSVFRKTKLIILRVLLLASCFSSVVHIRRRSPPMIEVAWGRGRNTPPPPPSVAKVHEEAGAILDPTCVSTWSTVCDVKVICIWEQTHLAICIKYYCVKPERVSVNVECSNFHAPQLIESFRKPFHTTVQEPRRNLKPTKTTKCFSVVMHSSWLTYVCSE